VIVLPQNQQQWQAMATFLQNGAGVAPGADLRLVGWVSDDKLVIVVGFNGFLGKVAQIHMAFAPDWHFTPRALLDAVFGHAFNEAGRETLLGIVSSKNAKAMRMDLHLGFREVFRLPEMHDEGGDLVVLAMKKEDCRYLTRRPLLAKTGSDD